MKVLAGVVVLIAVFQAAIAARVVCYMTTTRLDVDPTLCTHINYGFARVGPNGSLYGPDPDDSDYRTLVGMKSKNPNLKVLISVGGDGIWSALDFTKIAASPDKRAVFIKTARAFMVTNKFDGLDLVWEVPEYRDKANYVTLLQELKNDFIKNNWLVTAAVKSTIFSGYDVPKLASILDFFNVMSFDMYGPWSKYTGQNSALYPSPIENESEKNKLNVQASINEWIRAGTPAHKISAGVPFYGRTFTLVNPNNRGLHAPVNFTEKHGWTLTYSQYCQDKAWKCNWDDTQKMPICLNGDRWLGIENEQSIQAKVGFIKSSGLGGAMVWTLQHDDVSGACGQSWPLLRAVSKLNA